MLPYKKKFEFIFDSSSNNNLWISYFKFSDLDGDGKKEVIVKVLSTVCGSGADVYNLVIGSSGDDYKILASLPEVSYARGCVAGQCDTFEEVNKFLKTNGGKIEKFGINKNIINLFDNSLNQIFATDTDSFVEFTDLDGDGYDELIFAHPEWRLDRTCMENDGFELRPDECECHFCPHVWMIGVYKYREGGFVVDNRWNDGLLFVTNKMTLYDALGYKKIDGNNFGFIEQYYLKNPGWGDPFYTNSRMQPEILKIVKEKYNK